jgi:hypothetical protein
MWGVKKTICWHRISKGIKLGLVEKRVFYIADVNGSLIPIPHYFFKDSNKRKTR